MEDTHCRICEAETVVLGVKTGKFRPQAFVLRHCRSCHFSFVADPWTDYAAIYSEAYYAGKGADPLADYEFELDSPQATIRQHEWQGITRAIASMIHLSETTSWLDFGCGNGGLVRYCQAHHLCQASGFEEGAIRTRASRAGVPLLGGADLDRLAGTFDVVTAIEVLEHVADPLATLRQIRSLLKPGGLFFYTTGNARPYRANLLEWSYVVPEIHVSFFEPETLRQALLRTGFRPEFRGYIPGFTDTIRFKILKNLGLRRRAAWQRMLPWPLVARAADARFHITAHPVAWAE